MPLSFWLQVTEDFFHNRKMTSFRGFLGQSWTLKFCKVKLLKFQSFYFDLKFLWNWPFFHYEKNCKNWIFENRQSENRATETRRSQGLGALQKNALESTNSKILESESKSFFLKFIVKVEKSLSVDCCFMDRERYKCGGSTSNSLERLFSRAIKTIREVVSTTSQLLQLSLALFSHSKLYTIEWNLFWRSICSAICDWVHELMMIKCKNSKVSQMALQMLLQKRFHSHTTYSWNY